jgi:hypothetical protein
VSTVEVYSPIYIQELSSHLDDSQSLDIYTSIGVATSGETSGVVVPEERVRKDHNKVGNEVTSLQSKLTKEVKDHCNSHQTKGRNQFTTSNNQLKTV